MTVKCPKCGRPVEMTGLQPNSSVTCECGNVLVVPKKGMSRTALSVLIGVGVVVVACPCIGIMSAVAIPNFIRYQSRAKQAECMVNLKSFYIASRTAEELEGSRPDLAKLAFAPERGNRYAYFLGPGPMEDRSGPQLTGVEGVQAIGADTYRYPKIRAFTFKDLPPDVAAQVGVSGTCPDCTVTMACMGDIGFADKPDVWSISNQERKTQSGKVISAGEPYHHTSDGVSD